MAGSTDPIQDTGDQGEGLYQEVSGDEPEVGKGYWDNLYSTDQYVFGRDPSSFLRSHLDVIPLGRALDIGMGEGRNAVFLAKKGFEVEGVDLSEVALGKANRLARDQGVRIRTILSDVARFPIRPDVYSVILNINFLDRRILPSIRKGLRRGGVVVFENATTDQLRNPGGKDLRREYLLEPGELRRVFAGFEILVDQEVNDGKEAVARMIARKPLN